MKLTIEEREILTKALEALVTNRKVAARAFEIIPNETQNTKIANLYHKIKVRKEG